MERKALYPGIPARYKHIPLPKIPDKNKIQPYSLESLPSEIVENICSKMDPASLSNFSQSNWENIRFVLMF